MTLEELKALKVGEKVRISGDGFEPLRGVVHAIDERCIEIHWFDRFGTSTLIWFRHIESGMSTRHEDINRDKPKRKRT